MQKRFFGPTAEGKEATLYVISNSNGMRAAITDFGATVVSVIVKDQSGKDTDVILGYDSASDYQRGTSCFGATIGRNCNRIANAKYEIDGVEYTLGVNDNENNLHSGPNGLSTRFWNVKEYSENRIVMVVEDTHLQQGFPGNAEISVAFEVTEKNEFVLNYHAQTDQKTVFNFTNHAYFNLNGAGTGSVLDHVLQIRASHYTPVIDSKAIPTGEIAPVEGTPFDFREEKTIGRDINMDCEQLAYVNGYDHNYALDKEQAGVEHVATAYSKVSGIKMDVSTDCIGLQLYTGNFIGNDMGKNAAVYKDRDGFCLETQFFPNSVNEPNFVLPVTTPEKPYESTTIYAFSTL